MGTRNANTFQKRHANMHATCAPRQMHANSHTQSPLSHNLTLIPSLPCLFLTTHTCTHYTQHASTVTPMFDLLLKLQQLHFTSVSELWSAIAACILAQTHWGGRCRKGRPSKDSFVSVEQPLIPFSISWHSAGRSSWECQGTNRNRLVHHNPKWLHEQFILYLQYPSKSVFDKKWNERGTIH